MMRCRPTRVQYSRVASKPNETRSKLWLSTALLATESYAAKRTFAKKKGKTQMWITIIVVVCTVPPVRKWFPVTQRLTPIGHHPAQVFLALLCALFCKCGDRIYTTGNGPNRRYNNEQEPLIVEGKPMPPP